MDVMNNEQYFDKKSMDNLFFTFEPDKKELLIHEYYTTNQE